MKPTTLEICIDSIASGIAAEAGGCDRIELCSALSEGGLTPTVGFLRQIKKTLKIPIFVMIRPRGGDFLYSPDDIEIMKEDIRVLKENGADGFVFGLLNSNSEVDIPSCEQLLEETRPLPVTFHRAFDQVTDPVLSLEVLIKLGFTRILTSGQAATAKDGMSVIKQLVDQGGDRIRILAGAGVSPGNVAEIIGITGVKEVHASAKVPVKSEMKVSVMGSDDNNLIYVTDTSIVKQIAQNSCFPAT